MVKIIHQNIFFQANKTNQLNKYQRTIKNKGKNADII